MKYRFVADHSHEFPVTRMCRVLAVSTSGYYAWRRAPKSRQSRANERLLGLIKQFWLESGGVYGYRKIFRDLREVGVARCGRQIGTEERQLLARRHALGAIDTFHRALGLQRATERIHRVGRIRSHTSSVQDLHGPQNGVAFSVIGELFGFHFEDKVHPSF